MPSLDLLPRQRRIDFLEPSPEPAPRADGRRLPRPTSATCLARLQVVMAHEAQHHQVLLRVVAALQHPEHVVDIQLAVDPAHPADLASPTADGDQPPPPRGREAGGAGAPVVGVANPVAQGALGDVQSEGAGAIGGARPAHGRKVGCGRGQALIDQEEVERPRPLEAAALAGPAAALEHDGPSSRRDTQAGRRRRTHVRRGV